MTDNQRENIIRAASEKMRLLGIRSVSVDDICQDLGMSKKTFYVYFETKDALIDELLQRREQEMLDDLNRKTKGKTVMNLLLNFMKVMRDLKDVRQVPPLLYDLKKYYPQQLKDHLQRLKMMNRDISARFLQQGIDEGMFRKDLDVAASARILASLHQVMIDKMTEANNHPTIVADTKLAMDIFFRGLVSEEGLRNMRRATNS